jgi:hypothetical protein
MRQHPARITGRDRRLKFLQIGFKKPVGDDQCLDGLTSISERILWQLSPVLTACFESGSKLPTARRVQLRGYSSAPGFRAHSRRYG